MSPNKHSVAPTAVEYGRKSGQFAEALYLMFASSRCPRFRALAERYGLELREERLETMACGQRIAQGGVPAGQHECGYQSCGHCESAAPRARA
jgi:hypothetical protein